MGHDGAHAASGERDRRVITSQTGPQPADFTDVRATNLAVVLRFVRAQRAVLAGRHRGLHRPQQGHRVQPRRRAHRPPAAARDRPHRAPHRPPGHHARARRRGRTRRSGSRSTPTTSPWSRSTSPASGCCPGGAPSPAWHARAGPGRRRGRPRWPAGRWPRCSAEGREVLGLTVGVAGLVDAGRRGPARPQPGLARRRRCATALVAGAGRTRTTRSRWRTTPTSPSRAEYRYGPYAGAANLVYLNGQAGVGAGHHRRRPAAARRARLQRRDRPRPGRPRRPGLRLRPARLPGGGGRHRALVARRRHRPRPGRPRARGRRHRAPGPAADDRPSLDGAARGRRATSATRSSLLSNVVNPEVVLLGGYFVPLAPWLLPAAEAELRAGTVAPDAGGCRLTASALGQVAAAIGGAASILDAVDAGTPAGADDAESDRAGQRDPGIHRHRLTDGRGRCHPASVPRRHRSGGHRPMPSNARRTGPTSAVVEALRRPPDEGRDGSAR